MIMTTMRRCPTEDCHNEVGRGRILCTKCWRLVPRDLQKTLYAAMNKGGEGSLAYREARDACFSAAQAAIDAQNITTTGEITKQSLLAELTRELSFREFVYPKLITQGKLTELEAISQTLLLERVKEFVLLTYPEDS